MTPAIRISLGIVALTTSLLLATDWVLKIFPDPYAAALESRQNLSESLANQYSAFMSSDQLSELQQDMASKIETAPDILSMSFEKMNGRTLASTSEHAKLWIENGLEHSTPTQVLIPIFRGDVQWGVLKVKYDALPYSGFSGLLKTPLYKMIAVMAVAGFLAYLVYLSRMLRYLDPSSVVPGRVQAALDQLVEGVFILDRNHCIVLVNSAFAIKVGLSPDALIGVNPSNLPWIRTNKNNESTDMPWTLATCEGTRFTDVRLELQSPNLGIRVFTVNISPVLDDGGEQRGVIASFNDISELEYTNEGLKETLNNLEAAHEDVRTKNKELFRLATIDSLTECFNRRAFFEKLEAEFQLAMRDSLTLSVIMADIDNFKKINDDFGHGTGDIVIREMASTLMSLAGPNDCVGRYGGEEFCFLLVGAGEDVAIQLSDRARLDFESLFGLPDSDTKGRIVTASFGVSTFSFGAESVEELLNQADVALYASKNSGRNRVTSWIDTAGGLRRAS